MVRKEQTLIGRNIAIIIAAIIAMFVMVGVMDRDGVEAAEEQINVIKIDGSAVLKVSDTTRFYDHYYYIFAVVDSNGDVMDEISGDYGHLTFTRGVSGPEIAERAVNYTEYTSYENDLYVIGLPEDATLKVIGVRVREKSPDRLLMPEEAGLPDNAGRPYPVISKESSNDQMTCIQTIKGNILWASFRLEDDDGNLITDERGNRTYGGITFVNGVTALNDSSNRNNRNINVEEGTTSGYPIGDYWCYMMGNDDIFIITDLPEGVHVKYVAHFGTDICPPFPEAPVIKEYPRVPDQNNNAEYRVRHWRQTAEGDDYELADVDVLEAEVGSEVTAEPKDYPAHGLNTGKGNATGIVIAAEESGYPLVLNLYYDILSPAEYTVESYFEQRDGTYVKDGHKDGPDLEKPYSYTKTGYAGKEPDITIRFYGSDYNYNPGKSIISGIIKSDGSSVYKLYYDLPRVTLSYDLNNVGNGDEIPSETVITGSTVTIADPTDTKYGLDIPEGYTFNGWSYYDSSADETKIYNPGESLELYEDLELMAEWDIDYVNYNYYSVHHFYETDDGKYEERDWETEWGLLGKIGDTVSATPHSDNNWYEYYPAHPNNNASGTVTEDPQLALNLYYKQKEYTLSYEGNGATGGTAPASVTGHYEETVTVADNTFEKTGHDFDGWKDQHGKKYSEGDPISLDENKVLSAEWTPVDDDANYTVEHYKENIEGGYHMADSEHLSGNVGDTVNATPKSYDHYVYDSTQGNPSGKITATGDLVLKLYYKLDEHTLTYDGNGADSGTMESKTAKYESNFALDANAFVKEGYDFIGWNTTQDGSGMEYADKANFTLAKDTTLYAQWSKKSYEVKFDSDGGSPVQPQTVEHGGKAKKPEDPTKDSHDFVKWTLNGDDYDFNAHVTENITLKAVWKKKDEPTPPAPTTHHITYKLNGGTYKGNPADIVEIHELGSVIKVHEAPDARPGYTFAYWEGSKHYPGDDYTVEEDHVFKAVWTKNSPDEPTDETTPSTPDKNPDNNGTPNDSNDTDDPNGDKSRDGSDGSRNGGTGTGDDFSILLWLATMILSGGVAYGSMRTARRRDTL